MNTTEVAKSVVSGLSGSPMLLALIVLNAMILGLLFWGINQTSQRNFKHFEMLMAHCVPKVSP